MKINNVFDFNGLLWGSKYSKIELQACFVCVFKFFYPLHVNGKFGFCVIFFQQLSLALNVCGISYSILKSKPLRQFQFYKLSWQYWITKLHLTCAAKYIKEMGNQHTFYLIFLPPLANISSMQHSTFYNYLKSNHGI